MERVETLLDKLKQQWAGNTPANELLLTVQMLHAELLHIQSTIAPAKTSVTVEVPHIIINPTACTSEEPEKIVPEKIVEVLQIDESEVEAELQELKKNAETFSKISAQNKPHALFDLDDELPTLAHYSNTMIQKKEINQTLPLTEKRTSVNDKLKQNAVQLSDAIAEAPIRDLKKAIDINDRFLFINELFRGDEVMYERSIKTINNFSILPEAEYWIQRELKVKIGWNDNNELVQQFYQLVKRRFF